MGPNVQPYDHIFTWFRPFGSKYFYRIKSHQIFPSKIKWKILFAQQIWNHFQWKSCMKISYGIGFHVIAATRWKRMRKSIQKGNNDKYKCKCFSLSSIQIWCFQWRMEWRIWSHGRRIGSHQHRKKSLSLLGMRPIDGVFIFTVCLCHKHKQRKLNGFDGD